MSSQASPAWLSQGLRPFFLAAALWAAAGIGLWTAMLTLGLTLPSRFSPMDWHIHEMLFGFVMAAVAGFLLTAIPNWTGRPPIRGARLAILAATWGAGRIACLVSAWMAPAAAPIVDLLFPLALAALAGREILAARNWRNLVLLAPLLLLSAANLLMHLESLGLGVPAGAGWRLGLAAVLVLVSVIGGRIIPSFTRNWLKTRGPLAEARLEGARADSLALGSLHAGLFAWAMFPTAPAAGWLLIAGAVANLWRLSRWRGFATVAEPLLAILHLGYAWLVAGAALLGLAVLCPAAPIGAGVHALTVGAIGSMVLAVMSRASRGHTGRPLTADRATVTIYALVLAAAAARIAAAFAGPWALIALTAAAALWIGAFLLFAAVYGRMLLTPRQAG